MAKKEITKDQEAKFIAAYAKKHEVSEQKAKEMILHTGISRLQALANHAKSNGGGAKPKQAKPAKAKPKAKAKAKKAAPKKKAAPTKAVSEGEQG